ncbi:TonB-dependent receptor [Stakelama marina]|uniref:TonB-dependent receptor n=1 Tax=Stakelama marina TaxID=2826939 RepID=A0A8T4IFH1_9SPHN|nr:TonB-dependent receptor [Stakelama marina]MBR0552812.1 TonB-dependent receptor [Stakelama marina]
MLSKTVILCSASLFTIAAANPAFAQDSATNGQNNQAVQSTKQNKQDNQSSTQAQQAPAPTQAQPTNEIVVTGVRASIISGLENKRDSDQVIESIVAEDIGKLPDNNVVEALQRVTGVQVTDRGGDEASTILIRGLPDVLTTMNGRKVFTASGRSFALADIPANLVKRVDVYKTRSAEQIPTGIAGQIDVFTHRPFDFSGFALSGQARGIYDESSDTYNPNLSGLISDRWDTGIGDIGVMVTGSYSRTKFRDQSITAGALVPFATADNPPQGAGAANTCVPPNPGNWTPLERIFPTDCRAPGQQLWQPGTESGLPTAPGSTLTINGKDYPYYLSRDAVFSPDVHGDRKRYAANAALQWSPNSSSTYTAEFFWNRYEQQTFNNLMFSFVDWWGDLGPDPASTITLYDGTNIMKTRQVGSVFGFDSGDLTTARTDSYVYALNGKWDVSDLGYITADLSYQDSEYNTTFQAMRLNRVASQINVDFNEHDGYPAYNFADNSLLTDPAQWTVGEFYDNANRSKGSAYTLQLNGVREFDDGGIMKNIKVGVRVDDRKAADYARAQSAAALNLPFSSLDPAMYYTNSNFFQGRANVPTSWLEPNGYYIHDHADEIRSLYNSTLNPNQPLKLSDQLALINNFNIEEVTMAAYLQADAEIPIFGRPLNIQLGGRYVDVDTNLAFTSQDGTESKSASAQTSSFLPDVTLRYDITDNLRLRFNYGETIRRPNFPDLNPYYNLTGDLTGIGRGSGSAGNPNLQPTTSKNYDLGLEWYFGKGSAIYTTLFRREIQGLVVPITSVIDFATPPLAGDPANTTRFAVTRPENASNGVLKGAELGVVYFPDYLPGLLDGLGVQGSLTYLDSNQNIPQTDSSGAVVGETQSQFFGVSDLSYNVTMAYDHGGLGLRLSYVWRDNFLNNNEARLFANPIGVWRRAESSLDFQATYDITDRVGVTFDAVNLTKQTQQSYYKFEDAGNPQMFNLGTTIIPRTFAIGVRYSLK